MKATSTHSTSTPADAARRRFLTVAAAASAVSVTALAAAAMPGQQTCALASLDDSTLVRLEAQIFEHKKAIDALEPEVVRLDDIWCAENHRLHDEFEATGTGPAFDERKAIIDAMPEFKEYMKLRHVQESEREAADALVREMWEIEAKTAEGRRAKVSVLLSFVFYDDQWRSPKDPEDSWDVVQCRDLLIELVGGEQGEMLRNQYA